MKMLSPSQLINVISILKQYGATKISFEDSDGVKNIFKDSCKIGEPRDMFNAKFYISGVEIVQDDKIYTL
jgi:hypothetical protein